MTIAMVEELALRDAFHLAVNFVNSTFRASCSFADRKIAIAVG